MSQRRHSRSLQPSKAVLVSWEVDPECPTTATLAELLENKFGYTTASLRLPQFDAERLLADEIRNHMSGLPTDGGNPFVLYYRGGGRSSNNGSQLHWKSQNGSGEIDWLDLREELFDLCPEDVLIVVDCNHGSISTSPEASPLNSARSVEPLEGRGKLEILAAPQRREPYHYLRFTEVLIGGLQRLATKRKHFLIMDLVTEMQKSFGPDMPVLRYRPLPTQGDELDLEVYSSTTRGRQPSLPVSLNGSIPGALPAYSSSSLGYQSVIILPITWTNIEGWDAYGELKILLDVFRRHFDYVIAPTVQIQQNSGAHKFVRKEIARRLNSLGKRDLLIVIYNGHASDAYAKGNRMLLSESAMAAKNCTVDWTELTNELNRGDCDIVQILDCCYAAGATKGESLTSQETFQAEKLAQAANSATDVPEFQGRNETLAACGRDTRTAAGEHSSMKLFASVLHDLARKQAEFLIHEWYSHIDTVVGGQPTRQWCTPYHKMNPPDQSQKSIVLRTKQGDGSNMR